MTQSLLESSWDIYNYGKYINQFTPYMIKQYGNINGSTRKYVDRKYLLSSTKFVYIYIYIYVCVCVYLCVCLCVCVCMCVCVCV